MTVSLCWLLLHLCGRNDLIFEWSKCSFILIIYCLFFFSSTCRFSIVLSYLSAYLALFSFYLSFPFLSFSLYLSFCFCLSACQSVICLSICLFMAFYPLKQYFNKDVKQFLQSSIPYSLNKIICCQSWFSLLAPNIQSETSSYPTISNLINHLLG